jgi:hypothetical protein
MVRVVVRRDTAGRIRSSYASYVKVRNPIAHVPVGSRVLVEGDPGSGRTPLLLSFAGSESFIIWINLYHDPYFVVRLYGKLFGRDRNILVIKPGAAYDPDADMVVDTVNIAESEDVFKDIASKVSSIVSSYNLRNRRYRVIVDSLLPFLLETKDDVLKLYSFLKRAGGELVVLGAVTGIPSYLPSFFDLHLRIAREGDHYALKVLKSRYLVDRTEARIQFVDGEGVVGGVS